MTSGRRAMAILAAGTSLATASQALAQNGSQQPITLPEIEVIGVSPLLGTGVERDKVPANVQTLDSEDFDRSNPISIGDMLSQSLGSVNVNDAQNNPYQPNLNYRGFTVSPLLGSPQGLAIYQNGVRQNEAFGEAINWDLIPSQAISRLNLMPGSNPVFGLNALGGSISVEMKDGFNYQGAELELSGGYFGRVQTSLQLGAQAENVGIYTMMNVFDEDGWRNDSPSKVHQLYSDFAWRGDSTDLGLDITIADNDLTGNGTSPVELLDANRRAVFTYPDQTLNEFAQFNLSGSHYLTDDVTLQANAYYRRLIRKTVNGDGFDAEACGADNPATPFDDTNFLCFDDDGPLLRDQTGSPIAAATIFSAVGPGAFNTSSTQSTTIGGSAQSTFDQDLLGRSNQLVVGGSYDFSQTHFHSESELGNLTLDRTVTGTGLLVTTDPDPATGVSEVSNVRLKTNTRLYGLYFSDTWEAMEGLNVTLSGRYNRAEIDLRDEGGGAELTSDNVFQRFNPAVGATYAITPELTGYASYAESNRAPSAAELGCADPARPCRLPNAFVADPPLDQVVSRTFEVGTRGRFTIWDEPRPIHWQVGLFRTDLQDDILFINSANFGRGFFDNVGDTRRQGLEASMAGQTGPWNWFVNYSYIDATFQTPFAAPSANHPQAVNGAIQVQAGDTIPGIPKHQLKAGIDYEITDRWTLGGTLIVNSSQYFRGDEANLGDKVDGYQVVNLHSTYRIADWLEFFVEVDNVFDTEYETFGLFAEVDEVFMYEAPNASDPRAFAPGQPFGAWAGLRLQW